LANDVLNLLQLEELRMHHIKHFFSKYNVKKTTTLSSMAGPSILNYK